MILIGSFFKSDIKVVIIGETHSGKSTLSGRLLNECDEIESEEKSKIIEKMQEKGHSNFQYSWITDNSQNERDSGHTTSLSIRPLETIRSSMTLIDTPGYSHKDKEYKKNINMITGVSLADCAILVVSAIPDNFEKGIEDTQQIREHAIISHKMGLENIIIVVNKLDATAPPYSKNQRPKVF